jgi:hypothetical protein
MHLTFLLGASLAALALAAPTPGYYFNGNAGELGWTMASANSPRTNSPNQVCSVMCSPSPVLSPT